MNTSSNQFRILIGNEPSSEISISDNNSMIQNYLSILSWIIYNYLLIRKIDRQAIDRATLGHLELKNPPHSLNGTDIFEVKIAFDFINGALHLQSSVKTSKFIQIRLENDSQYTILWCIYN